MMRAKSELEHKKRQFQIISDNNPSLGDIHTWIRSVDDIKTYEEAINDTNYKGWQESGFDSSYTDRVISRALSTGRIRVYSSRPIKPGTFVTPSEIEARSYAGSGKIYSKEVDVEEVAWIDAYEGMYTGF